MKETRGKERLLVWGEWCVCVWCVFLFFKAREKERLRHSDEFLSDLFPRMDLL